MCLTVATSHVRKPIHEVDCFKVLHYSHGRWVTPFQYSVLDPNGPGWFVPKYTYHRSREFPKGSVIEGGYLHASTSVDAYSARCAHNRIWHKLPTRPASGMWYRFHCVARDVVAFGHKHDADLACRALYIPAFDLTGANRNAIVDYMRLAE